MANNVTSFFQTLVAAASEASEALVGKLALIDKVYIDYKPIAVAPFSALTIPLPDLPPPTDIGNGSLVSTPVGAANVTLTFQKHPAFALTIMDFEQYRSAEDIRSLFLDAALKRGIEYINGQIAGLLTTQNFGGYGGPNNPVLGMTYNSGVPIPSTAGVGSFNAVDWASAWGVLANAKVEVDDIEKMFMITTPTVYTSLLTNNTLTQGSQVGYLMAEQIRRTAALGQQFSNQSAWDQQMPRNSNALLSGGTVATTAASATITGTGTNFVQDLTVGASYNIAGVTAPVVIASIASATSATATASIASTASGAGMTIPNISILFHKNAIALALRHMPDPDPRVVDFTTVFVKGVPIRIMLGYNQQTLGYTLSIDYGYALGVVRPNMGQLILS